MKEKTKMGAQLVVGLVLVLIMLPLVKAEAAAKPEGTLTIAVPDLAEEGFLPDRCSETSSPLWESVYDFLIYSDNGAQGKTIPGIAERWEYSKDYRTLTFWLRKGVQFNDGWGEVTAEDVKFTIEFNTRPTSINVKSTLLKNISAIDVIDRYKLVIHLKEADPVLWLSFYTAENLSLPVLCKKYIETVGEEKANRQPVGSGPYRLVEYKLGDHYTFEAVEKHWLVVPEFKTMILRLVPEEATRIAMVKTGEIDIAMELGIDKLDDLEKAGLKTVVSKDSNTVFIPFGGMLLPEDKRYIEGYHRKDPWKDLKVREAMNIAVDRKALVKTFYRGLATPAPIYATLPGWDKLEPIPYDPKRAKQLLAEAGYPNGFSFKLYTHVKEPMLQLLAEAAGGYWEAIGLKAEITRGDYGTWRDLNKTGKTAGWLWTNAMLNYIDWSGRLPGHDLPNSSTPFWQSEETTAAIKKVLREVDPQKREAYFKELARVFRSLYINVPIAFTPRVHAVGKKVGQWYPGRLRYPKNLIFARHPKSLNTYRLFTP